MLSKVIPFWFNHSKSIQSTQTILQNITIYFYHLAASFWTIQKFTMSKDVYSFTSVHSCAQRIQSLCIALKTCIQWQNKAHNYQTNTQFSRVNRMGNAYGLISSRIITFERCYLCKRRSKAASIVRTCLQLSSHRHQLFNIVNVSLKKPKSKTITSVPL